MSRGQIQCVAACEPPAVPHAVIHPESSCVKPAGSTGKPAVAPGIRVNPVFIVMTLAILGSLAIGVWQYRQTVRLERENRRLEANQNALIENVQTLMMQNEQLRTGWRRFTDSLSRAGRPARSFPSILEALPDVRFENGLPVSFDNGDVANRTIALTFDGAAYDNAAADILDTLAARGVKATMFVTGGFILKHADVVRRMAAEGHDVGNHTFSHPHLTAWERERMQATLPEVSESMLEGELARTAAAYEKTTGAVMLPIWRAPYGERNRQICGWGQAAGYLHVAWRQAQTWRGNLDSYDWVPEGDPAGYHPPQEVCEKIMALAKAQPDGINGGIILMHLGTQRTEPQKQFHRYLGRLIDDLQGMGYRFVTVTEMARESGVDFTKMSR